MHGYAARSGCQLTLSGDTLASELGMLARIQPVSVTTLRKVRWRPTSRLMHQVPAGTNGGITSWGSACSAFGGLFIGVIATMTLLAEAPACRNGAASELVTLIIAATAAGLAGSLVRRLSNDPLTWTARQPARRDSPADSDRLYDRPCRLNVERIDKGHLGSRCAVEQRGALGVRRASGCLTRRSTRSRRRRPQ